MHLVHQTFNIDWNSSSNLKPRLILAVFFESLELFFFLNFGLYVTRRFFSKNALQV